MVRFDFLRTDVPSFRLGHLADLLVQRHPRQELLNFLGDTLLSQECFHLFGLAFEISVTLASLAFLQRVGSEARVA